LEVALQTVVCTRQKSHRRKRTKRINVPDLRVIATEAIAFEARCRLREATRALRWVDKRVKDARRKGYATIFPDDSAELSIIARIISSGEQSSPGSAHAAIEKALLNSRQGESAIILEYHDASLSSPYSAFTVRCT